MKSIKQNIEDFLKSVKSELKAIDLVLQDRKYVESFYNGSLIIGTAVIFITGVGSAIVDYYQHTQVQSHALIREGVPAPTVGVINPEGKFLVNEVSYSLTDFYPYDPQMAGRQLSYQYDGDGRSRRVFLAYEGKQ